MPLITELPDEFTSLPQGGVRSLLRDIGGADDDSGYPPIPWTGCIVLNDTITAREARIYLNEGAAYAAHLSGYVPPMAMRLRSTGFLSTDTYEGLLNVDPALIGPQAVMVDHVPSEIVEGIHREVMLATIVHLYEWEYAVWRWENDAYTNDYITAGIPILLVVSAVDERIGQWNALRRERPDVVQQNMIPLPGASWESKIGEGVPPEMTAVLSYVNGRANIGQISATCGFTRFESARLFAQASADGILIFVQQPVIPDPEPEEEAGADEYQADLSPEGPPEVSQEILDRVPSDSQFPELWEAWAQLQSAKNSISVAEERLGRLAQQLGISLPL